jgi:hypothetical protein
MQRHPPKPSTIDWGGPVGPGPQTASARELGRKKESEDERDLGRSESLDEDGSGDIADEGPGHRG